MDEQVQSFCTMLRTRGGTKLAEWLETINQSGCPELQSFAAATSTELSW